MSIFRKTCAVFSNYNNKLIRVLKFGKKQKINILSKNIWFLPNKAIVFNHSFKSKEIK